MTALDLKPPFDRLFGKFVFAMLKERDRQYGPRGKMSDDEVYFSCLCIWGLTCHHPTKKVIDHQFREFTLMECWTCKTQIYYDHKVRAS